jgi:hypothetical protein
LISAKTEFDAGDVKQLIYALYDVVLDTPHDLEVQVRGGGASCFPVVQGWGKGDTERPHRAVWLQQLPSSRPHHHHHHHHLPAAVVVVVWGWQQK